MMRGRLTMKKKFVSEPYLLSLAPATEMNIVWIQREPVSGMVEYDLGCMAENGEGIGSEMIPPVTLRFRVNAECHELKGLRVPASSVGYEKEPADNPEIPLWQCIAKIEGLRPGQQVYYRCHAGEEITQVYYFHTAPELGNPFRFAQMSDLQGNKGCDVATRQIGGQNPDFVLYSGDAVHFAWKAEDWFDLEEDWQTTESAKQAFFPCMQQAGVKLLQYCPLFICPGNHEVDDVRVSWEPEYGSMDENWSWSVYMQLFRPLYPEFDPSLKGKRWYSADYSDLHIVSLSVQRYARWSAYTAPGWRLTDSIAPDSPQIRWLEQDLRRAKTKFKWVIMHWHLLNKGHDVQPLLCQPVIDEQGKAAYPQDHGENLMDVFEAGGVNGVSFGHSHVYERYYAKGAHYIEAANFTICYREQNAPAHPSGRLPIVEDNSRKSFLMVERREDGLFGVGYYMNNPVPEIFDSYQIADKAGKSSSLKTR